MVDPDIVAAELMGMWNSLRPEDQVAAKAAWMDPTDARIPLTVWTNLLSTQLLVIKMRMLYLHIYFAQNDPAALLAIVNEIER